MNLTGKCKQDFEAWFDAKYGCKTVFRYSPNPSLILHNYPISMQFWVLQEFADSVGFSIEVWAESNGKFTWIVTPVKAESYNPNMKNRSRQEAQEAAITAFNNLYNEK